MATRKGIRLRYVEKGHAGLQLLTGLAISANVACNCENPVALLQSAETPVFSGEPSTRGVIVVLCR